MVKKNHVANSLTIISSVAAPSSRTDISPADWNSGTNASPCQSREDGVQLHEAWVLKGRNWVHIFYWDLDMDIIFASEVW